MRAFEIRFLGGPYDGGRCRLSTPPPDVLFLPIQADLPATVPLYSLTVAACAGAHGLSEYELDLATARRPPEACIVLNYRMRRLIAAPRSSLRRPGSIDAGNNACSERAEPSLQPLLTRWQQFKRLMTVPQARLKRWFRAPLAKSLLVSSDVR
jgi:hypothetical protein